jgi:plasmid stabilization system protein ParE
MAPVAVRFHPAAAQEAESAYAWYAGRDPFAAHGFREELRHAVDLDFVTAQSIYQAEGKSRKNVPPSAASIAGPCARVAGDSVIAVAHGRRRPGYWRSRR